MPDGKSKISSSKSKGEKEVKKPKSTWKDLDEEDFDSKKKDKSITSVKSKAPKKKDHSGSSIASKKKSRASEKKEHRSAPAAPPPSKPQSIYNLLKFGFL